MMVWDAVFWGLGVVPATAFALYPAALRLAKLVTTALPRPGFPEPKRPVTLVISAFNEEGSIRAKLENALGLDYPAGLLEILVATDGSTDRTDGIVREFADRGVRLLTAGQNRGKTAALAQAVRAASHDILVFTDANTEFHPRALRRLLRWFELPQTGCVCGRLVYTDGPANAAACEEVRYWNWDSLLKKIEGDRGALMGGNGSILALRREIAADLPPRVANDFAWLNYARFRGYAAIFEPRALAFEATAGTLASEFRRRVRIINRGWRGIGYTMELPRREPANMAVGRGSWALLVGQMVTKKLTRYLAFPALFLMMALLPLLGPSGAAFWFALMMWGGVLASVLASAVRPLAVRVFGGWPNPVYPLAMGIASLVALCSVLRGRSVAAWRTHRETTGDRMTQEPARVLAR